MTDVDALVGFLQLAAVAAHRRIVERCVESMESGADEDGNLMTSGANLAWDVLRDMASVYSGHPDYREEWRA